MSDEPTPKQEILSTITGDPKLLLGQIRHFVMECRKLLDDGGEPDLNGMDDQVRKLCGRIKQMAPADAEQLRPRLDSLVQELDELARALTRQKEIVLAQLQELNRQHQANTAYQKAGATGLPMPAAPESEE